jgi:hypothetical protein
MLTAVEQTGATSKDEQGELLLANARTLIDFADWIGPVERYGSVLLQDRACDRALTALGTLVADLAVPLPPVRAQLDRLPLRFDTLQRNWRSRDWGGLRFAKQKPCARPPTTAACWDVTQHVRVASAPRVAGIVAETIRRKFT